MNRIVNHWRSAGTVAVLLLAVCSVVLADDQSPTTRPLLDELNRETQSLFKQSAPGIVRLQLPISGQIASEDDPLARWDSRLDPDVRQKLEELEERGGGQLYVREDIVPATAPSDSEATTQPHIIMMQLRQFTPNSMGVVIDNDQHVIVPRFISRDDAAQAIPAMLSNGRIVSAKFIGSDRPTQMTVLQLQEANVAPAVLGERTLVPGTLLMVMSLNPGLNRLAVWQGWEPDLSVLVTLNGQIAGFAAGGQFMPAIICQPIVKQIIQYGEVHRALLGVVIGPVGPNDPQRKTDGSLGDTPAVRIHGVLENSTAEKAGLRHGDLILQLADQPVGDVQSFAAQITDKRGKTDLLILRDGQRSVITVDLEAEQY